MGEYIKQFGSEMVVGIGLLVGGIALIVFRKKLGRSAIEGARQKATAKQKEELDQLEAAGFEGLLFKFFEVVVAIFGVILVIMGSQQLFLPEAEDYVVVGLALFVMCLFACGGAGLVIFKVSPLFWRKVERYTNERYAEFHLRAKSPSMTERLEFTKWMESVNDPILRGLRREAWIYTIVCFIIVFALLFFAEYLIVKATA